MRAFNDEVPTGIVDQMLIQVLRVLPAADDHLRSLGFDTGAYLCGPPGPSLLSTMRLIDRTVVFDVVSDDEVNVTGEDLSCAADCSHGREFISDN